MVEHDAVGVVDHLALEAELDRTPETALGDGSGLGVVEGHHPAGAVGDFSGEPGAGLGHDLFEDPDGALEFADEGGRFARGSRSGPAQPAAGIMATIRASLMVASAMVANSPVRVSTSSLASPLRRRSQAAI